MHPPEMSTDNVGYAHFTTNEIEHPEMAKFVRCTTDKIVDDIRFEEREADWVNENQPGDMFGTFLSDP